MKMHMNLQKILIYLNKKDENVLSQLMSDIFSVTYFQNADEAHRYFERGRDVCGERINILHQNLTGFSDYRCSIS